MPQGTIDPAVDYVAQFSAESKTEWPTMRAARMDALELQDLLRSRLRQFTSDDVDVVYTDDVFLRCREISQRLHATLQRMFFEIDTPLREFTCEYGVF